MSDDSPDGSIFLFSFPSGGVTALPGETDLDALARWVKENPSRVAKIEFKEAK